MAEDDPRRRPRCYVLDAVVVAVGGQILRKLESLLIRCLGSSLSASCSTETLVVVAVAVAVVAGESERHVRR